LAFIAENVCCLLFATKRNFVNKLGLTKAFEVPVMAQAVNRRLLISEVCYPYWASPCENHGGKTGTESFFFKY